MQETPSRFIPSVAENEITVGQSPYGHKGSAFSFRRRLTNDLHLATHNVNLDKLSVLCNQKEVHCRVKGTACVE
jgi:hypothetical protein